MKIEMGESLMYSWLRHIKGCQIAQLNWKTANVNIDRLKISQPLFDFFKEEMHLKSTLPQFLRQAEIDVLGIRTNETSYDLFAIDIAFHENGLGYSDNIDRIAKKLLRSALILHNQFDAKKGNVIFACPKVSGYIIDDIKERIEMIGLKFVEAGFNYKFDSYTNKQFQVEILAKILLASKNIKDTYGLFVRSVKLLGIFDASMGSFSLNETLSQEKIAEFIQDPDSPMLYENDIVLEKDALIRKINGYKKKSDTIAYKIINKVFESSNDFSKNNLLEFIASDCNGTNPEGTLRSMMTNKGNNYGEIFILDNDNIKFHPNIIDDINNIWRN